MPLVRSWSFSMGGKEKRRAELADAEPQTKPRSSGRAQDGASPRASDTPPQQGIGRRMVRSLSFNRGSQAKPEAEQPSQQSVNLSSQPQYDPEHAIKKKVMASNALERYINKMESVVQVTTAGQPMEKPPLGRSATIALDPRAPTLPETPLASPSKSSSAVARQALPLYKSASTLVDNKQGGLNLRKRFYADTSRTISHTVSASAVAATGLVLLGAPSAGQVRDCNCGASNAFSSAASHDADGGRGIKEATNVSERANDRGHSMTSAARKPDVTTLAQVPKVDSTPKFMREDSPVEEMNDLELNAYIACLERSKRESNTAIEVPC